MADLKDQIHDNAKAPQRVTVDGNSAVQHPLREQAEADRYVSSSNAVRKKHRGLRFNKLAAPGAS